MKKIVELKKLLEVCAEDSSRKKWMRSRRNYEYRNFSEGKSNLKKVTDDEIKNGTFVIPDGVTEIRDWAFENCTSLESIIIPKGVAKIGIGAFYGCSSLTNITIPESVTKIWDYAFDRCRSLKKISLSKRVKLGYKVFFRCHPELEIEYRD